VREGPLFVILICVKPGQIATLLADNNRWWRDPQGWHRADPTMRSAQASAFRYRAGALRDLVPGGLYVLRGPRRAGKSTEVKYAIQDLLDSGVPARSIVHASVEGWRAHDLRTMISSASQSFLAGVTGRRTWFVDEVTGIPDGWPDVIKNLRDTDPRFAEDTVVLTGSSAAGLAHARKALAGRRGPARSADLTLLPMTFADVVEAAGTSLPDLPALAVADLRGPVARAAVDALAPYLADIVRLWESYLRIGGFPQAVDSWLSNGDVDPAFTDTLWDVVHGDAIAGSRFSAGQSGQLLQRLATSLGSTINVSSMARDLDVGRDSATARLADLTEHYLAWPCHREQGLHARLASQSKWYFVDPLLARLAAVRGFGSEPDRTVLSEQQVGVALLRATASEDPGYGTVAESETVLHHRSATGAEIDFVGRSFGTVAVESKYVDGGWGRTVQTLRAGPWQGVLATRSGIEWRDDVVALPAGVVAVLLSGSGAPGREKP
jgi:predicted AAA+ superfamily ATPase